MRWRLSGNECKKYLMQEAGVEDKMRASQGADYMGLIQKLKRAEGLAFFDGWQEI